MPKQYNTKPTNKQKESLKNFVENRGNISRAMREAGYQEATAKNPKNLTESKGWQELWKQNFSPERTQALVNKLMKEYEETDKIKDKRSLLGLIDYLTKVSDAYPDKKINLKVSQQEQILDEITIK